MQLIDNIIKRLTKTRRKDSIWSLLLKLIEKHRIHLVLDVGANTGQFAKKMRKKGYHNQIISFEPQPRVFEALSESAQADLLWRAENIALGSAKGTLALQVTNSRDFASFLKPNPYSEKIFGQQSAVEEVVSVEVHRLDDYLAANTQFSDQQNLFLKLDTQGFDREVLEGATDTLQRLSILQIELSLLAIYEDMPDHLEMLEYVDDLGFAIAGFYPISRDPDTLAVIEADCVLIRK